MEKIKRLIFDNKKTRKKALKNAANIGAKVFPIAKTVQAVHGVLKIGEVANKVGQVADQAVEFIPSMQVMGRSLCDSVKIATYFNVIATSVGIGANIIQTYQGVQALQLIAAKLQDISSSLAAQAALDAQKYFPQYVYNMISERLDQTSNSRDTDHWFFVYHPDDDWYPKFYHYLQKRRLGPRFGGYTNQIDTVFVFMLAVRQHIDAKAEKASKRGRTVRPVKLHLLIPAYQTILIAEPLKIPQDIGDFVMEGRINSNKPFVWFNLPEEQKYYVMGIGQWIPPEQGWLDWAMSTFGLAKAPPKLGERRVLGTGQEEPEDVDDQEKFFQISGDEYQASQISSSEDGDLSGATSEVDDRQCTRKRNRHHGIPLHRQRPNHWTRYHRNENGERRRRNQPTSKQLW